MQTAETAVSSSTMPLPCPAQAEPLSDRDRHTLHQLAQQHGTPLLVLNLPQVVQQVKHLQQALPGVSLFYAIKALNHPALLHQLHGLGVGFDVATTGEIRCLQQQHIPTHQGVIHTHPMKKPQDIQVAIEAGIRLFVVDNQAELDKFAQVAEPVQLLLRVGFRSQEAVVDLSRKFGCAVDEVAGLVQAAQRLGLDIIGLSFHVGSQALSPVAQTQAIETCHVLMQSLPNVDWQVLDIGGSFPVAYHGPVMSVDEFCHPIRTALAPLIEQGVSIWAEPGRFIAAPSVTEILSVVGKAKRGAQTWYYLDDGVYGALSGQMYDHAHYPITPLASIPPNTPLFPSVLAGPTCDSIDVINESIDLPSLAIGDYLLAQQMGAYTLASATEFNAYPKPKVVVQSKTQHGSVSSSP